MKRSSGEQYERERCRQYKNASSSVNGHRMSPSAKIVTDRETGRSKGFGFVEMADAEGAERAIQSLNDKEMEGRRIKVNIARPKKF